MTRFANTTTVPLRVAGAVYVAAWVGGLLAAPTGPEPGASASAIHAPYLASGAAALVQSLLVHGVAGIALGAVVVLLRRRLRQAGLHRGAQRAAMVAGLTAAALSLVQVALLVALVAQLDAGDMAATAGLRHGIDLVDAAKLLALGLLAGGTVAGPLPGHRRIVGALGAALAPALWLGALSFLLDSPMLTAALYLSLPLLLVWVLAMAFTARPALQHHAEPLETIGKATA